MNHLVYGLLIVAVLVGLAYYIINQAHTKPVKHTCEECAKKGGKCLTDKDGHFSACRIYKHQNPHKGGETFVAKPRMDAMYKYYGLPNFPL